MSLQFPCPCGRVLQVSEELNGKRVRCPSCQRIVWAPAEAERVPEARVVDSPASPKIEPVSARPSSAEPPFAQPVAACSPSPAPAAGGCCAVRHDCGAVGGFMVSLGSLVFGVATLFPVVWPIGGSIGALISCGALRRIRQGRANPASVGLARAGAAIGLGQAMLGLVLWVVIAAALVKSHHGAGSGGCCFGRKTVVVPPPPVRVVQPAPGVFEPDRVEKESEKSEETHGEQH
ncbi:MAG: hypothetical protein K8T20_16125 [Planctomycetes bacterium]|nr:hypothetical protein [Planctomycetota bacterium]